MGSRPVLSAEAARVLGALLEKERTVPDTYPMTLNALVNACNQSSNRAPVVTYDSSLVQRTLDQMKDEGLARFVYPSHGERTTKFRQVLDERLSLSREEAALVCVLLLRGPQTVSELRTRSERLATFDSVSEVASTLDRLAGREEPLVQRLPRRAGEREERWMQTLTGDELPDFEPAPAHARPAASGLEARVAELETRVAALESILHDLGS